MIEIAIVEVVMSIISFLIVAGVIWYTTRKTERKLDWFGNLMNDDANKTLEMLDEAKKDMARTQELVDQLCKQTLEARKAAEKKNGDA